MERIYLTPNDALWMVDDFQVNEDGTADMVECEVFCRVNGDPAYEYSASQDENGKWYYEA
jgi:hypothetical protein